MSITKRLIFKRLELIEDKLGTMAHELPDLEHDLKDWQDGKLSDIYFNELLAKYLDAIAYKPNFKEV